MNNTTLATIQPQELDTIQRAAALLAASGYFDGKGETRQAIAMMATKIMAGRELGFGPFASANGVHIIQGRPSIGANLMASAVKNNSRYDYRVRELTSEQCTIEFFEREGDKKASIGISTFTMDDAKAAQLAGKDNWRKHPKNMLFARALSNGVRWFCADVFAGNAVYVPEELGAEIDDDGNVVDVTFAVAPREASGTPQRAPVASSEDVDSNGDIIFDREADDLDKLHRHFHALGTDLYGDQWDMVRKRNASRVSNNRTDSSKELTADEVQALINGMKQLKQKREAA